MKQIPLFGEGINAHSPTVSAQRRVNCFYDARKDGDKNVAVVHGTPGVTVWLTLPSAPVRGFLVVKGVLYAVAGAVLYSVTTAGTVTALGSIGSSSGKVSITDNGNQIGIADGVGIWCYTLVTNVYKQTALNSVGAFGQVTDPNTPNGTASLAYLSSRILAQTPNTQFVAVSTIEPNGPNDITDWTLVSSGTPGLPMFFVADTNSDNELAVDVLNGTIVVWGPQSIEFWQDVGASPNPFARITGAAQTWGLAALYSRQQFMNTMIFLGQNPQGGVQFMLLDGYTPKRVSTSDIEDIIEDFATYTDAVSLTYMSMGHPMYQVTFPGAGRTFLYDGLTSIWQETQTGLTAFARHFAELGVAFNGKNYVSDTTTGKLYVLEDDVYMDAEQPIKREIVSRHISNGGNLFGVAELLLDMETGVGLQSGQGSNPQLMLEVSKNGGVTWGQIRQTSLGRVGKYSSRVVYRRLGAGRDFVFRFTLTDPVKFTIMRGSLTIMPMEGRAA